MVNLVFVPMFTGRKYSSFAKKCNL